MVLEKEIVEALKKGARTTTDIQKLTRAGTSCGRCLPIIDALLEEYLENLAADPQQKIDFRE
jgi:nitrite reductase (NADH) large subunit